MPRSKRLLQQTAEINSSPPPTLTSTQQLARVQKAVGNNLYSVVVPTSTTTVLVELPSKFRNLIWIKRGGYVLIDTEERERDNKITGEIINVVREEKEWRSKDYWPKEFEKKTLVDDDDDSEDESTMGKMPPSDGEED